MQQVPVARPHLGLDHTCPALRRSYTLKRVHREHGHWPAGHELPRHRADAAWRRLVGPAQTDDDERSFVLHGCLDDLSHRIADRDLGRVTTGDALGTTESVEPSRSA